MSKTGRSSKRLGLRFAADGYGIRYKTEFEDGSGELENISAGGCAVKNVTIPLALGEKVLVVLHLEEADPVEIGATVVRIEGGLTALKFVQISEENRKNIVTFFAKKQRSSS